MELNRQTFEDAVWPHLKGAYNLARWLTGNAQDAEDVVQESFLKAYRALDRIRSEDARSWVLAIVRNTALTYRQRRKPKQETEWSDTVPEPADLRPGPEGVVLSKERREQVRAAIAQLPEEYREVLVLRELEGLSYKEIAWVLKIPLGTVMSRLSRARILLMQELLPQEGGVLCAVQKPNL